MNSTLLRILAILLAVGALLMGWSGYRMSVKSAQAVQHKAPPPTYPQVTATHDIPSGRLIESEDVAITQMPRIEPQGYDHVSAVIGKLTLEPIKRGEAVRKSHFPILSAAAQALHPGERAVAVKVNEVAGLGGFLTPGDRVDVLLYLRADRETANTSSAQVILRDARVLAFGDDLGDAPPASTLVPGKPADAADAKSREAKQKKDIRSAILAVPEQAAARLMLADSAGQLRLALRGAEPPQMRQEEGAAHFTKLETLASAAAPVPASVGLSRLPEALPVVQKPKRVAQTTKQYQVIVHNGDQTEVMHVSN